MHSIKCANIDCKFHTSKDKCEVKEISIDCNGCNSFEKGWHYYINLVWQSLTNTNMIPLYSMTDDLRIGIYYIMKIYKVQFKETLYGTWKWITLHSSEDGQALNYEDFKNIEPDEDEIKQMITDVLLGKLPKIKKENDIKKTRQPFGWLSPTGEFTEGEWGDHAEKALEIIREKHFDDELVQYMNDTSTDVRDFLTEIKGYALIHNPSMSGGYIVTHIKELTKHQKEFLYDYFMEIGDRLKAESFIK